jgi:hypothetical protein
MIDDLGERKWKKLCLSFLVYETIYQMKYYKRIVSIIQYAIIPSKLVLFSFVTHIFLYAYEHWLQEHGTKI